MRVALILSGCGFRDGAEIHESVLSLLALSQGGHEVHFFAPDIPQSIVMDHLRGREVSASSRNVLVESARIARGKILALSECKVEEFDTLMIPGGFGVAVNLSSFGKDQENCTVNKELRELVLEFYRAKKPIGATCIAPAVLGKIFQGEAVVSMTLGKDKDSNMHLSSMGMNAESAAVDECVCDEENRVFTTPAYMEPDDLPGMFEGIKKVVANLERSCKVSTV